MMEITWSRKQDPKSCEVDAAMMKNDVMLTDDDKGKRDVQLSSFLCCCFMDNVRLDNVFLDDEF